MQLTAKSSKLIASGGPAREPLPDELPLQQVYRWERETPLSPCLTQPVGAEVRNWDWSQTMDETRRMAAYLSSRGWPPASRIAILAKNSAWWIMAELAVWMSGHVTVPIYASLSAASVRALLEHCAPVAIFIGAMDDKVALTEGIPAGVERIVCPNASDPAAVEWQHIVQTNTPLAENAVREGNDIATIIYTSGATGTPKGAMHRFSSFVYSHQKGRRVVRVGSDRACSQAR